MSIFLTVLITYLAIGLIISITVGISELESGVIEFDSKPKIIFNLITIIVGWLPLIIKVYILD